MDKCRENVHNQDALDTLAALTSAEIKIRNGANKPIYATKKPLTEEEKFGFAPDKPPVDIYARRKAAYDKWLIDPFTLSISELEDVQSYRLSNDPTYEPTLEEILGQK